MSEETLWAWLRPYLPDGQYSRVETGDTCPGFPDVHYQLNGVTGHLELKDSETRKVIPFPDENKGLHRTQRIWIREHLRHGGTVWIVAKIRRDVLFIPGRYYSVFNGAKAEYLYAIAELVLTQRKVIRRDLKRLKHLLEKT